jgi:hypothetical protein
VSHAGTGRSCRQKADFIDVLPVAKGYCRDHRQYLRSIPTCAVRRFGQLCLSFGQPRPSSGQYQRRWSRRQPGLRSRLRALSGINLQFRSVLLGLHRRQPINSRHR